MLKRSFAILSIVLGVVAFLVGCSKDNHETLAFVGDESEMISCYDIYPAQYFPISGINYDTLVFPPDIVGEYEMNGTFFDGYYEKYNQSTHQYDPYPTQFFPRNKIMNIVIEEQVNGMAKIRFRYKTNSGNYQTWHESDAYIYGNVFSENSYDFLVCFDDVEDPGNGVVYYRGNIIKGTINETGIVNVERWSVIRDRTYTTLLPQTLNVGGYEHYHADFAARK